MEENEQFKKYIDETLTEEYITELKEKAAKKLNRQILFRSIFRWLVAIIIGIISAKQNNWVVIINIGWKYITIEFVWLLVYYTYIIYRRNKLRGVDDWYAINNAFSFGIKTSWKQLIISSVFIGSIASVTKLISNIFI